MTKARRPPRMAPPERYTPPVPDPLPRSGLLRGLFSLSFRLLDYVNALSAPA